VDKETDDIIKGIVDEAQALTAELRDRVAALLRTGDIMPDTDMTPIPETCRSSPEHQGVPASVILDCGPDNQVPACSQCAAQHETALTDEQERRIAELLPAVKVRPPLSGYRIPPG
jgi:hypothetical protein